MVPTATLRVFEPLDAFSGGESEYWQRYVAEGRSGGRARRIWLSRETGVQGMIATAVAEREHADVLVRDGRTFVCPHRTRLRLLAAVLAFRRTMPAEAVAAFMDEDDIERAVANLERLRSEHPEWRNHILLSPWEIPLRWFVLYDDTERELVDRRTHLGIRYETSMEAARRRAHLALGVLRETMLDDGVVGLVTELASWLESFHEDARLVLDYAGVARLFPAEQILEDRSAAEIWGAIAALDEGDPDRATAFYGVVAERWSRARARQSSN